MALLQDLLALKRLAYPPSWAAHRIQTFFQVRSVAFLSVLALVRSLLELGWARQTVPVLECLESWDPFKALATLLSQQVASWVFQLASLQIQ